MALDETLTSSLGLLNISRKIADIRKYDSNLIETVGNVTVLDNKASGFSKDSYLHKSNLIINHDNILISCAGNFSKTGSDQVAWLLSGSDTSIALHFCDNQVKLAVNDYVALQFSYLQLEDNTEFKTFTELTGNSCKITLYVHDLVFEKTVILQDTISLSNLRNLYIGNEPEELGNNWIGSINLDTFKISSGSNLIYTPSTNYPLTFSKVLISDGEFPLNDSTLPIANHIYEYEISEVTRSGGTLLLTSQITDDSKLIIKEIGFYANDGDQEFLYSSISNLNINKGEGVNYDLVFTLNLYTGFVNVVGFPDYNSFLLKEPKLCPFQDFTSIKEVL